MKTILDIINLGEEFLKNKGFVRARREAEELIADALGFRRIDLYLNFEKPVNSVELDKCRACFVRRSKKEPPQYILGHVSFAGVKITVNPNVLIPRPETEILVEKIAEDIKDNCDGKTLLDMCTGSGCIGIALKKRFPNLKVILSDVSKEALAITKENAIQNSVEVEIVESDLFSKIEAPVDFFVCNPPYVSDEEYKRLAPELFFEPKMALVGGDDGLFFYKKLSETLFSRVNERAWLEIGKDQKAAVLSLFQKNSWGETHVEKDWSGLDRFLYLRRSSG